MVRVAVIFECGGEIAGELWALAAILKVFILHATCANFAVPGPDERFGAGASLASEPFGPGAGRAGVAPAFGELFGEGGVVRRLEDGARRAVHSACAEEVGRFICGFVHFAKSLKRNVRDPDPIWELTYLRF